MIQAWPPKDPDDNLRYYWDFSNRLAAEGVGGIVTYEVFIDDDPDGALVIGDIALSPNATILMVWISGGTLDLTYIVRVRVTLIDGTTIDHSRSITIAQS